MGAAQLQCGEQNPCSTACGENGPFGDLVNGMGPASMLPSKLREMGSGISDATAKANIEEEEPDFLHHTVSGHHDHDPEHHRTDGYGSESDSSEGEEELEEETSKARLGRRFPVYGTKFGPHNKRIIGSYKIPSTPKSKEHHDILMNVVKHDELFLPAVERMQTELVVGAFEVVKAEPNAHLVDLNKPATDFYIVLEGSVEVSACHHGKKSAANLKPGQYFGDEALLWHMDWSFTAIAGQGCVLGKMGRTCYQTIVVEKGIEERERRIGCLHKVSLLETFNDEQISKIEEVLHLRMYHPGDIIMREAQPGHHFFIVESGECKVYKGVQEYSGEPIEVIGEGNQFGDQALIDHSPRDKSVVAKTDVELLVLSRGKFERLLGTMKDIHEEHAKTDPRQVLARFFCKGTNKGPLGHLETKGIPIQPTDPPTKWFAVFRPTSRDAITKLTSGQGVGKGLNVKGKSAKKGVLSGFVPFLQISSNDHKHDIEVSPKDSWLKVYYRSTHSREDAMKSLTKVFNNPESRKHIELENPNAKIEDLLKLRDEFAPHSFGVEMPEGLLHEAYIELEDLTPHSGWETGRASEPAFMDMNFHAIRHKAVPEIVLWQFDELHPMNPHGLLVSYAEAGVKPVVSDFDAFLIASMGMEYAPLPADQVDLQKWALDRTEEILKTPSGKSWTGRWLDVLHDLAEQGEHHDFPKFGYGDATTVGLVESCVHAVRSSGGLRHGAECFNFHFPQELDEDYMILWDGYQAADPQALPFAYCTEPELRAFLAARASEGYTIPLNPTWPVRDPGWYEVFTTVKNHPNNKQAYEAWYPKSSGILDRIEDLAKRFPERFKVQKAAGDKSGHSCASKVEDAEAGLHAVKKKATGQESIKKDPTRREG